MSSEEGKKKTIKLSLIISLALSFSIIILILYFTIDAETINKLASTQIKYEFFAIAILLNILYWVLWGARLKVLANAVEENVKISLWKSTKIVIANLFLACVTPSMAGGEPVRIYLLNKEGMSIGHSTAAVLGERLIDAIFIVLAVPFAIYIYKDKPGVGFLSTGLTIGIIVFIILIVIFLYAILKPEKVKSLLIYISKKLRRFSKKKESESKTINRINNEVDKFHKGMKCFVGEHKKALLKASILTILFWSTGFLIPSFILLGLGLPPFWVESYTAQILLLVIIMMPTTPGSTGIAEIGIFGLYGVLIGTSTETLIGPFIILYRFISFHMNLIAGGFFQYKIFKSITSFSIESLKQTREKK